MLLGLPAALLAHAAVFGSEHTLGGSAHGWFVQGAGVFAFLGTLLLAIGAVGKRRDFVPHLAAIVLGASAWFAGIELCEQAHGVPFLLAAAAIAGASWIVRAILVAFAQTVAVVVGALDISFVSPRPPLRLRVLPAVPSTLAAAERLRLFSRPPPAFA